MKADEDGNMINVVEFMLVASLKSMMIVKTTDAAAVLYAHMCPHRPEKMPPRAPPPR